VALLPQDRRGQLLLAFFILALAGLYFVWSGTPIGGISGVSALAVTRDSLQNKLDSLDAQVQAAQRVVRQGTVAQMERRLAEYRATLDLMRQLVPAGQEMPNLLDDISSRAKVRGATVANWVPATLESGSPFDVQRVRVTITGQYDQIGEYLSDVASLTRIIVPYDIRLSRVTSPAADTAHIHANTLMATFQIRTYVKPQVAETARPGAPPATTPRSGT